MSEPKISIPKFGSFKPKLTPPVDDQVEGKDKSRAKSDQHDQDNSRSHHEHHRSRRSHSKDRRRDRSKGRHDRHHQLVERKDSPPPSNSRSVDIFVIDRKGDEKNLLYGSVHRYSVPPFYRAGAGSVLGIPSFMRIDRDYGDEKGIILNDRRDSKAGFREKYIFSKVEKERPRLLKIRPESETEPSKPSEEENYIPLQSPRGQKRKRGDYGDSSGSDEETNYRSIHGKAKERNEPEDENLQYATESDSGFESGRAIKLDASVRQKTVELSRKVEQFPHDITAWLALINHQDALIRAEGDQRRITSAEIRSTADIKIHLYEKALEQARSLDDRETLLLGLMTEGAKIWELKAQSEQWEQISKDNIDSLVLWKSYLNFRQTTFGTFQYEEVRDIFVQRIKALLDQADAGHKHHHQIAYILLRLTILIRESGYSELAVAIWQGLLEFNFFAPSKPLESEEKIALFKEFWESEVPRIGEDNALGWRHFVENEGASEAPDPLNDEEGNLLDNRHIFKTWAVAEQKRSMTSRMPARTMDEVVEDDPFRVILASDIEDFLVSFPSESEEVRTSLVNAFLLFCHLPAMGSLDKALRDWSNDSFISGDLLDCSSAQISRQFLSENDDPSIERQTNISSIFSTPGTNFQNSPESIFDLSWFKSIQAWQAIYSRDHGPVTYRLLRNTLKHLLQVYATDDLAEYYLAFEWRNEPETIKKISKSLLRQHPSRLRLYNAYAMIEWSRGNRELANNVFSAALEMRNSLPDNERDGSILLWKSWIWGYLEVMDNTSALNRLLSIEAGSQNDDISATPFQLLKTKQHLSQRRDYHLYSGATIRYAIIYAECMALLEYLSAKSPNETQSNSQGNISAALSLYTSFSQTLNLALKDRNIPDVSSLELLLQSAARLLYHHARIGPFRPAFLREHLTSFLNLFPQNTIFQSLYSFNECRLRIDNRVRTILSSTILTPENDALTSRLFAIYYEISHGTIYSARTAFEHALSAPASKSSPGLWRLYIIYCLSVPQFKGKVKEVWYRALRACPWVKELYIEGFERLGDDVEFAELKDTWRVMGEKGLRVHVDLEDKFDELKALEEEKRSVGTLVHR